MAGVAELLDQSIFIVPSFTLECGRTLRDVPIAYKTWGKLNEEKDNVMIICHAFTGSADVEDWWGPLMGKNKAFDPSRFFIFCANVTGSPYGSASPVTPDPTTGRAYGPSFPPTSIRDDVRLHKLVLDALGVRAVAVAIGGSMGGMAVLEWPLCTPPGFVRRVLPIATSARHSAWCISWGEAQRQSIYSDPGYMDGWYATQPAAGLAAARMAALLTYRSRDSFEARFGRRPQQLPPVDPGEAATPRTPAQEHNEGHPRASTPSSPGAKPIFSAQGYLRYQGAKFVARFDANCYIAITRKLDTHDIARGRSSLQNEAAALAEVLSRLPPRALVIGIATDGLFTIGEQREIAAHVPEAELVVIHSPDGHDGFLLEFEQINGHVLRFLRREFPELYLGDGEGGGEGEPAEGGFEVTKTSMFGEAEGEADITRW